MLEEKGGSYGTDCEAPLMVFSGTTIMPMNLAPDTGDSFRVAPYQNGQPGVWVKITIHTMAY